MAEAPHRLRPLELMPARALVSVEKTAVAHSHLPLVLGESLKGVKTQKTFVIYKNNTRQTSCMNMDIQFSPQFPHQMEVHTNL